MYVSSSLAGSRRLSSSPASMSASHYRVLTSQLVVATEYYPRCQQDRCMSSQYRVEATYALEPGGLSLAHAG